MTKPLALLAMTFTAALPATALAQTEPRYFMPEGRSNHAEHIDWAMHFINGVTVFFFVLIIALMVYFAIKYRRRSPHERARTQVSHNTALELFWSLPPGIIVIFMFYIGFQGFMDFDNPPLGAKEIRVTANTWDWTFNYANGYQSPHLHVPENTPVVLSITSRDVLHSVYIPAFRVKRDAVPGKDTYLWFEAYGTTPGADEPVPVGEELDAFVLEHLQRRVAAEREEEAEREAEEAEAAANADAAPDNAADNPPANPDNQQDEPELTVEEEAQQRLAEMTENEKEHMYMRQRMEEIADDGLILYCAEYCGTGHSVMLSRVVVHPEGWEPPPFLVEGTAQERGEQFFHLRGCAGCHQLPGEDPRAVAAPDFVDGIYMQEREMDDGRVLTADRSYLERAIRDPMADVTAGYPPAMPPGLVPDDDELADIIEFLIALPDYYEED